MKISKLTLPELELELKRARFWVEQSSIGKSIKLIEKMEERCIKLTDKDKG